MSESKRSEIFSSEEEGEKVFFAKMSDSKKVKRACFESEDEENEANKLSKNSTLKKKRAYLESENEEELIEESLIEKDTNSKRRKRCKLCSAFWCWLIDTPSSRFV